MNNDEFESLWQEAGARAQGSRLAAEYPRWQRNRRRTMGVVAMAAVVIAAALPMLTTTSAATDTYSNVYCNRSNVDNSQWAALADALLKEA